MSGISLRIGQRERGITLKAGHIVRHFTKNRTERERGITRKAGHIFRPFLY